MVVESVWSCAVDFELYVVFDDLSEHSCPIGIDGAVGDYIGVYFLFCLFFCDLWFGVYAWIECFVIMVGVEFHVVFHEA